MSAVLILTFGYAIRNGDYGMLSSYDDDVYHIPMVQHPLIAIQTSVLIGYGTAFQLDVLVGLLMNKTMIYLLTTSFLLLYFLAACSYAICGIEIGCTNR